MKLIWDKSSEVKSYQVIMKIQGTANSPVTVQTNEYTIPNFDSKKTYEFEIRSIINSCLSEPALFKITGKNEPEITIKLAVLPVSTTIDMGVKDSYTLYASLTKDVSDKKYDKSYSFQQSIEIPATELAAFYFTFKKGNDQTLSKTYFNMEKYNSNVRCPVFQITDIKKDKRPGIGSCSDDLYYLTSRATRFVWYIKDKDGKIVRENGSPQLIRFGPNCTAKVGDTITVYPYEVNQTAGFCSMGEGKRFVA